MKILVSNDDGYQAPGIICLAQTLQKFADVTVVAPDRNRTAAGSSLTVEYPFHPKQADNGFIYVDGTPADCVHLAITGLLDQLPDMVVSGINAGSNLGDDIIYSGTVGAAIEGRFLGLPALAISMTGDKPQHYQTAAWVAGTLLKRLQSNELPLPVDTILNVNIPDIPLEELQGMQVTRLGRRHHPGAAIKTEITASSSVYRIGSAGDERDAGPGTDFYAISHNFASITPLHIDLTHYSVLDKVKEWLNTEK